MKPTIVNPSSDKHLAQLTKLAEFLGLDSIRYEDRGNAEKYSLTKAGRSIIITAAGNAYDGGFLTVSEETHGE